MPARRVGVSLKMDRPGTFMVEVMGHGPSGPVVLVNVPLFVGVAEERLKPAPAPAADAS